MKKSLKFFVCMILLIAFTMCLTSCGIFSLENEMIFKESDFQISLNKKFQKKTPIGTSQYYYETTDSASVVVYKNTPSDSSVFDLNTFLHYCIETYETPDYVKPSEKVTVSDVPYYLVSYQFADSHYMLFKKYAFLYETGDDFWLVVMTTPNDAYSSLFLSAGNSIVFF